MVETEFDDVCYIIGPINFTPFKVTRMGNDMVEFYCSPLTKEDNRGYTTISLAAMKGLKFAGYKFIRSEKEFLMWQLKHG